MLLFMYIAIFNLQQLLEKYLCNQTNHYKIQLQKYAITCYHQIDTFAVSNDEWDGKNLMYCIHCGVPKGTSWVKNQKSSP